MGESLAIFGGGLLQGLGEGQKARVQQGYVEAQKALIDQNAKLGKLQLDFEQKKMDYLSAHPAALEAAITGQKDPLKNIIAKILEKGLGGGSQPSPQYAPGQGMPPFAPGGGATLPETMASSLLSPESLLRGVLKKEMGVEEPKYSRTAPVIMPDGNPGTAPMHERGLIDMTKAVPAPFKQEMQPGVGEGMTPIQTPVNPYSRQPMGPSIQTGPPPTMQVETPTLGGGKKKSVVPLFPGGGKKVTGTAGGVRTELDLLDIPIMGDDVTKWTDGKGNNPPVGWTPRQAQARGFNAAKPAMAAETGGKAFLAVRP